MAVERHVSALPPAQPTYIFRGHAAHIHSVRILHHNTRLLTGDADGWLVLWKLESKRPLAVWKAHEGAILGTDEWTADKLVTHGRDNALRIWQIRINEGFDYSTILPTENTSLHRPQPWLLHSLPVNTLNFCAFSMCHDVPPEDSLQTGWGPASPRGARPAMFVAVPARDDHKIEVYQFPDEKLVYVVPRVQTVDTGMVMAVKLTHHRPSKSLMVIAGYESGFTAVHLLGPAPHIPSKESLLRSIQPIYLSRPHTQPVLSLDSPPDSNTFFTSSADAIIARHCIPDVAFDIEAIQSHSDALDSPNETRNDAQSPSGTRPVDSGPAPPAVCPSQMGEHRNIGEGASESEPPTSNFGISTAGRPSSEQNQSSNTFIKATGSPEPLTFSKRHVAPLPKLSSSPSLNSAAVSPPPSNLAQMLSTAAPLPRTKPSPPQPIEITVQPAQKTTQTKHAGQQSLKVRSDGRLLATGGWDSRIRIYSTKTLREVAVLKWHKEGVYAVGFAEAWGEEDMGTERADDEGRDREFSSLQEGGAVMAPVSGLSKLQLQREKQIQTKHWVVAGAKDGKVSLWEVF